MALTDLGMWLWIAYATWVDFCFFSILEQDLHTRGVLVEPQKHVSNQCMAMSGPNRFIWLYIVYLLENPNEILQTPLAITVMPAC